MNKIEAIAILKSCQRDEDAESAHGIADSVLLAMIKDPDIKREYNKVKRWYA